MAATEGILNDLQVSFVEIYTPASTPITSGITSKVLEYVFFMTSADCNITVVPYGDGNGNTVVIAVKGGAPYPFAVKQITAVSTGSVYILHNNKAV